MATNFPMNLNPQLVTNASNQLLLLQQQRSEAQVKFAPTNGQNGHPNQQTNQQQTTSSSSFAPNVRSWLTGNQDRILVGTCVLALIWLTVLFVSPLVRRRFLGHSKLSLNVNGSRTMTKAAMKDHQNRTTNWRFNKQHNLYSRTSSTNEINPFGTGGGGNGGGSSSSSSVVHKFGLQQPSGASLGFGGASAACNYYGPPESNGADSSEHDMVQSCSQSSHYEEFIQHQIQQRLHNQPLYFNQSHLVESTTLSRRPLVKQSASSASTCGNNQNLRNNYQQRLQQQQQQLPATMRANLSNVPLIGGLNHSNSSTRFNFSDLQGGHSRVSPPDRYAMTTSGTSATNGRQQQHHYSFGKVPLQPTAASLNGADGLNVQIRPAANNNHDQEPIYDDVN
jgi:hypothetical protein